MSGVIDEIGKGCDVVTDGTESGDDVPQVEVAADVVGRREVEVDGIEVDECVCYLIAVDARTGVEATGGDHSAVCAEGVSDECIGEIGVEVGEIGGMTIDGREEGIGGDACDWIEACAFDVAAAVEFNVIIFDGCVSVIGGGCVDTAERFIEDLDIEFDGIGGRRIGGDGDGIAGDFSGADGNGSDTLFFCCACGGGESDGFLSGFESPFDAFADDGFAGW